MPKKAKLLTGLEKARAVRAANLAEKKRVKAMDIDEQPEEISSEEPEMLTRASRREPTRTTTRESEAVSRNGRAIVRGHGGEVLTRSRTFTSDQFEIPGNLVPKGWSYQWNTVSVHGNTEVADDYSLIMQQNGWRPVPAERYAGTLLPPNAKGSIIRGGERLEERPVALTREAKFEDEQAARQLISDRNESLKLTQSKKNMPDGFEMSKKYRGTGGDIRMSIDKALDIPRPQHELAGDDD